MVYYNNNSIVIQNLFFFRFNFLRTDRDNNMSNNKFKCVFDKLSIQSTR